MEPTTQPNMDIYAHIDSRVTPSTDGETSIHKLMIRCIYFIEVNVLGDPVKRSIIKRAVLHEDHGVEVHVLTIEELQPFEDRSLALDHSMDAGQQLELLCGLHGNIFNKLPSDCHLVSPIVMVKSGANRPLLMRVTIPHALATTSNTSNSEVDLFAIDTFGVIGAIQPKLYTLNEKTCIVTILINKQRMFVLTVMGKLLCQSRSFPSVNLNYRPPAIKCIYCVLSEPGNHGIIIKVYCAIDLPISWKVW